MKAVTFLIQLHEPVLAGQTQSGEANSAMTFPFIPGSMIRGALFGRYANGKTIDIEQDNTVRRLFLDGTVCYLNAYPAHPTNQIRALPKPLSWFVPKEEAVEPGATICDFAIEEQQNSQPYKPPSLGDFVWQTRNAVQLGSPEMVGIVHNTSEKPNYKNEENSQVYRYEAIAAGQWFAGVIVSEDEALLKEAKAFLEEGDMNVGGSHTAGYGRVAITDVVLDLDWQEFMPLVSDDNGDFSYLDEDEGLGEFDGETAVSEPEYPVLTCLSDLIWRDKQGQINAQLLTPSGIKPYKAFYRLRRVGGFNHKWGLPLCQSWAIQAGSVFVFPPGCEAELSNWVETGIGERRAEGFGRVALNWHTRAEIEQSDLPDFVPDVPKDPLSVESMAVAQEMANRQLKAQIDLALTERIQLLSQFQSLPKTAQLSRARLAARRAWYKADLAEITNYFFIRKKDDVTGEEEKVVMLSPTAVKQWERAKVNNRAFKKWILDEIENVNDFTLLTEMPKVAGVEADFSSMREETLARLIEGVLRQAVKFAKVRDEGGQNE